MDCTLCGQDLIAPEGPEGTDGPCPCNQADGSPHVAPFGTTCERCTDHGAVTEDGEWLCAPCAADVRSINGMVA